MLQRALEGQERMLGADNEATLATLHNLSKLYGKVGRVEEAVVMGRHVLSTLERTLGPSHYRRIGVLDTLGEHLRMLGRVDEASPYQQLTIGAFEQCLLSETRAAVCARRRAVAQGRSPGAAALDALPPSAAAAPGSAVWVSEWAAGPAPSRGRGRGRGRQQGRVGRRGGAPHGGSGRGNARASATSSEQPGRSEQPGQSGASSPPAADEGLEPLPSGLVSRPWSELKASHLPEGDSTCAICLEDLGEAAAAESQGGGGSSVSLVVQLACRHSYCELCVRQLLHTAARQQGGSSGAAGGAVATCPQCRGDLL